MKMIQIPEDVVDKLLARKYLSDKEFVQIVEQMPNNPRYTLLEDLKKKIAENDESTAAL